MTFISIYVTFPNKKEARQVVESLVRQKLIACANYISVESVYILKGKIENTKEIVSIMKTRKANWIKVKKAIEAVHSYDVPCIIKFNAEFNLSYAQWIADETK
jgi:periplasmic divalent cation tolerance protein